MGFINNARKKIENNVNTIPISNQNNEPIITKNEVKNNNIETNNEIKQKIENNNHNEINNNDITNNDSQNKNIQNNNLKIYTDFDKVIDFLTKLDGKAKINEINQILGSNSEYVLKILEKQNIIKIKYPINLFSEPSVILNIKPTEIRDIELPKDKELNDSYILDVDGVTSIVNIWLSKKKKFQYMN